MIIYLNPKKIWFKNINKNKILNEFICELFYKKGYWRSVDNLAKGFARYAIIKNNYINTGAQGG